MTPFDELSLNSLSVMEGQSRFSAWQGAVVACAPFLDRLWCQEVCKTWRSLLQAQPSELERISLLSHELLMNVGSLTEQQHIMSREKDPPTILLVPELAAASSKSRDCFSACCRWLMQEASLTRKLKLGGVDMAPWQIQEVVCALQVAPPHTSPAIKLTVLLGKSPLTTGMPFIDSLSLKTCAQLCQSGSCRLLDGQLLYRSVFSGVAGFAFLQRYDKFFGQHTGGPALRD